MRVCVIAITGLIVGLGAGCSKSPAPDYDRAGNVEVRELVAAFQAGDYGRARRQLERLQAAAPNSAPVAALTHDVSENLALHEADAALAEGDVAAALERIETEIETAGASDRLRQARALLRALRAIQTYRQAELRTARDALAAVAALPPPEAFAGLDTDYAGWRTRQEDNARQRVRREAARLAEELAAELDLALVTGSPEAPLLLARLGLAAPDNPVWQGWSAWARTGELPGAAGDPAAADVVRFLAGQPAGTGTPASFCGRYNQALNQLSAGNLVAGLAQLRQLQATLPNLAGAPARRALGSRATTSPTRGPNATDLLQLLYENSK